MKRDKEWEKSPTLTTLVGTTLYTTVLCTTIACWKKKVFCCAVKTKSLSVTLTKYLEVPYYFIMPCPYMCVMYYCTIRQF